MDPRTSAQDVMRCDLCETAVVQMHCDTCLVNLCTACVGKHMISDESKDHKVVKFSDRKSSLLFPRCKTHTDNSCELQCEECDIPVCAVCIASRKHKEHMVYLLKDILAKKKAEIQTEIHELEESLYPTYQDIAEDVQNTLSEVDVKHEELLTAITKHGEEWHREIDKLVQKLKDEVHEMKNKHYETLKEHFSNVQTCISKMNKDIDTLRKSIDSYDVLKILNFKLDSNKYRVFPSKLNVSSPHFSPPAIQEQISLVFGKLIPTKITEDKDGYTKKTVLGQLNKQLAPVNEMFPETVSFISEETGCMKKGTTQKSLETGCPFPLKQLLDEPETVTTIDTGYDRYLVNVACLSDEEIWTRGNNSTMKLFSVSQGNQLQSLSTAFICILNDIAMTKSGNLIFANHFNGTVNIVKNNRTEEVIRLQNWNPLTICSTSSDDILVVMEKDDESKVVRYSGSTEKQTIQFDEDKPLYSQSGLFKHITENKNLDICVADNGFNAIVVVNMTGKLRFRYAGNSSSRKVNLFSPRGITTDSQSHILTADVNNDCVHIIDQDGQFLRYIDCGLSEPWGLCTDTNDNLFIAQHTNKQVKKIKYLL